MNWNKEYRVGEHTETPTEYLRHKYNIMSDSEIAMALNEITKSNITKNAVKKRRHRLGLYKESKKNNEPVNKFEIENNQAVAQAKTSSLDDLISMCNVDLSIWEVESFKTWQGYAKVDGEMVTIPLSSASFVRKEPIEVKPTIKPVQSSVHYKAPIGSKRGGVKTALVFGDPHFGFTKDLRNAKLTEFHNRSVLDIILNVVKTSQPSRIDILGDIFDFAEWSDKFLKAPEFYWTTQPAILEAHHYLRLLREACPRAIINLHQGNHDKRPEIAISKHLASAYDLRPASKIDCPPSLSIQNLLDLNALGINYIGDYPNDSDLLGDKMELMHGKKALAPFRTVQALAKNSQHNNGCGHIHRLEAASYTHWTGRYYNVVEAVSGGCTCWIDGRVPGVSKQQQWQNGFLSIEYIEDLYNYKLVPIKPDNANNFKCIYSGWVYSSNDDINYANSLPRLYPDYNW